MSIQLAIDHHLAGRFSQAEAIYQKILDVDPFQSDALYLLGMLALQAGEKASANDFILKAIDACPSNPMYYKTLGDISKDDGKLDDASARYRQAILHAPDDQEALNKLAQILQQQHKFDEALDCYYLILTHNPNFAEIHNDLAVALMALGRLDEAIDSFKKALSLKPDFSESWNNLGAAYKNKGDIDEAAVCYRQALLINPNYDKALFNLGTTYFIKKDFEQAKTWYRASLAINPDQVEAHQNLAAIFLDAGKLDEAQQHRDFAYRKQAIFIDTAPNPAITVLVLWAAGKGNIPIDYLLPRKSVTRIVWMMEYATEEQARTLPHYDLVFNAIGDPDATGPTSGPVEVFLKSCSKPVLNFPAAIERTARDKTRALFEPIANVVVPVTERIDPNNIKAHLLALPDVQFPMIVRPSGSHGGDHLVKLESAQDVRDLVTFNAAAYFATSYYDYRSSDDYYRKYRIVFIDRRPYAYHLAISKQWLVHYETADMLGEAWKLREEERFLENPVEVIGQAAMAAIEAIGHTLDLDYCGVDFSILPDGRVLVFEANATMLIHPEHEDSVLAYKNPYVQRIFEAFNALVLGARTTSK